MYFSVYTLGCKLNQLETEAVTDSFRRMGFTLIPWDSPAPGRVEPEIMVINTCTVTSMADQKARRLIRKALRDYPRACLFVTGCYAQMEGAALAALENETRSDPGTGAKEDEKQARRLFVIPGEKKDLLLDLPGFLAKAVSGENCGPEGVDTGPELRQLAAAWFDSSQSAREKYEDLTKLSGPAAVSGEQKNSSFRFRPVNFAAHSRGFLKIQDGCDRRCAYCRVSLARGKSRSLGAAEVLAELKALESRGFAEAVLTGVNITQYRDNGGEPRSAGPALAVSRPAEYTEMRLPELLDFLLRKTKTIRIRLSSIEPDGLTGEFIRVLENPRIRPHFHLSVQAGSPEILAKMGRPYGPADIERAAAQLRSIRGDPFLAADIIAGFPGETEKEFEKTLSLCERVGFAWIHAFPFSPRPGTPAYTFPERVNEKDAARRVEQLTRLAVKGRREYTRRWEGREVEAIAESGIKEGFIPAVSENYLKLHLPSPGLAPGAVFRCRILPSPFSGDNDKSRILPPGIDALGEPCFPAAEV